MARKGKTNKTGSSAGATQREMTLTTAIQAGPLPGNFIIDASRCLSNQNRRLYRQARTYRCKISLTNPNTDFTPTPVFALANTWGVRKAIETAQRVYHDSVKDELELVTPARWHDFRIKPDASNSLQATPVALNAVGTSWVNLNDSTGEYQYSEVSIGTGIKVDLVLFQASVIANEFNIFEEFNAMGAAASDPVVNLTGGYNDAAGYDITTEAMTELLDDGNLPPYDLQAHTSIWVQVGEIGRNAAGESVTSTGYFDAPLGIIWMPDYAGAYLPLAEQPLVNGVTLEVAKGDYKGVLADEITRTF